MEESHFYFWHTVTRLGESEILLPAFLAGALWLVFARPAAIAGAGADPHPGWRAAWRWVAGICLTTFVTTASKIAFLGFGIGSAAFDFTGFSGHSMYSAAILPVLGAIVLGRAGAVGGTLLALVVMLSRVLVHAHSSSEALTGTMLGLPVAWWAVSAYLGNAAARRAPLWLPVALAAWLVVLPGLMPRSRSHDLVTALSLALSGRSQPYTRDELLAGLIRPVEGTL